MLVLNLPALNPSAMTGAGNNTWLIDGSEPTLIDAGVGVPAHIESIAAALGGRALRRVLVTHGHRDHSAGVPALRARWPDIEVCAGSLDQSLGHWPAGSLAQSPGHWPPEPAGPTAPTGPIGPTEPTSVLADRAVLVAGDRELTCVYTPGHAIDHFCFWDPATKDLFAGDMVVRGSTVMIPAAEGGGLRAYLASLERLAALGPERIYPGHGPVIDDPLDVIAQYLEHRRMRDAQVAACLADGVTDPDAIVARIYPDLSAELRPAARATVEAHLAYLAK